jgi:hypothetical protein
MSEVFELLSESAWEWQGRTDGLFATADLAMNSQPSVNWNRKTLCGTSGVAVPVWWEIRRREVVAMASAASPTEGRS